MINTTEILKDLIYKSGVITGEIKTNLSINDTDCFSLYPTGESQAKTFINGDKLHSENFVFYCHKEADNEEKRNENIEFLKEVSSFLNGIKDRALIEDAEIVGVIKSISAQNGMLFNIPGSLYSGFTYQLQIKLNYKIFHKKERNK